MTIGIVISAVITSMTGDGIWIAIGLAAGIVFGARVHQISKS